MPVKKNYTLLYLINNFENQENELIRLDGLFDKNFDEFNEVFELLDKIEIEPDTQIVKNIVDFSKSYV